MGDDFDFYGEFLRIERKKKKSTKSEYFDFLLGVFKDESMIETVLFLLDSTVPLDRSFIPVIKSKIINFCEEDNVRDLCFIFSMGLFSWNGFFSVRDIECFFQDKRFDFVDLVCRSFIFTKSGDMEKTLAGIAAASIGDFYIRVQYQLPDFHCRLRDSLDIAMSHR